jgi:hypothetical protein
MSNKSCLLLLVFVLQASGSTQTCEAFDPEHHNSPVCEQATMYAIRAEDGYVSATGQWVPSGEVAPKESIVELTCINAPVSQVSNSRIGFCLMAASYLTFSESRNLGISTNYYDIVSWGKSRILAERDEGWPKINCEQQQLVIDFPSNTVTLTSTLSLTTDRCTRMNKDSKKQTEVFLLKHYPLESYPSNDFNPFLQDKAK